MNPLALYNVQTLPALPIQIGSLDGINLDMNALKPRDPGVNGERAIANFRSLHAPERLPYYRHYYLSPTKDGHQIRYAWNLKRPKTDIAVGVVKGDDLPAIRVHIGNQLAGAFMSPIRWELYEDRDGEELIAMGRFDAWSLLQGVTEADIKRLAETNVAPNLELWDFDRFFMSHSCPGCGAAISVNHLAYNIDSARCANCGKRPYLSSLIENRFHVQPHLSSATGVYGDETESTLTLLDIASYLGHLDACLQDVVAELPDGLTAHEHIKRLHARSGIKAAESGQALALLQNQLNIFDANTRTTAIGAAAMLSQSIKSGCFSEADKAAANLLQVILRKRG